jgi:GntR family transcriptional regulator of vanillate catabolism
MKILQEFADHVMTQNSRATTGTNVLIALRNSIMNGNFSAGERLTEMSLSKKFGVSRTPLRQALEQLVSEGLLARNKSGGCIVSSFSLSDAADAIEIRGVLEGTAVRLAAERGISETQKHQLLQHLDKIDIVLEREHFSLSDYVTLNTKLHDDLNTLCGSEVLLNEIQRVNKLPAASPAAFLIEEVDLPDFEKSIKLAQDQHQNIVEAIINREGGRAEYLAREHARLARKNLEFVMNRNPKLAKKIPGLELITSIGE